ncbi:transposase [Nesterenkonia sp.]|uniref:transposase n=1 Tax=Nesterenkonia sp. TaxID=704201 RepID=UPI00263459CA|nr:transposase [Nesterenkonia sp.]
MPKKFSPEFRDRAVRMVFDRQTAEGGSRAVSIRVVAQSLGCGPEALRNWCSRALRNHQALVDAPPAGESPEEEVRRLRRELAEAQRANEILKKASAFFAAELARPTTR